MRQASSSVRVFQFLNRLSWSVGIASLLIAKSSFATPVVYTPLSIELGQEIKDTLTDRDIPTGQGSFARDYAIELKAGDQVAIDLLSETFDPMVILMTKDGVIVAENDDGPDGTSNSLLFMRIVKTGNYIVRVRSFGETAGGAFRLTITPLKKR